MIYSSKGEITGTTPDDVIRKIYAKHGWTRHDKGAFSSCSARCAQLYEFAVDHKRLRYVATPRA